MFTPMRENQMEKNMDTEMETAIIQLLRLPIMRIIIYSRSMLAIFIDTPHVSPQEAWLALE